MTPAKVADAAALEAEAKAAAEASAASDAAAAEVEAVEPEGVTVVMVIGISGLRDGEPWPAPGESIVLPADEAALYIANGYAKLPADEK
ncbi:hypothetical protein [Microbacterium rhizomatis]|uniref:Uncharacterized protein n=1 Tax=Microbacterium rhizomatis TaxID=1631477 RepID=A0A5J5J3Z9_9MICO|nr:hypothetical protein [Microbacterium rhizomatis]KAA9110179.1 hypothetical protein F6B43_00265 [Microbacterium rhizomatis]